jgi:hypothetical protein
MNPKVLFTRAREEDGMSDAWVPWKAIKTNKDKTD